MLVLLELLPAGFFSLLFLLLSLFEPLLSQCLLSLAFPLLLLSDAFRLPVETGRTPASR